MNILIYRKFIDYYRITRTSLSEPRTQDPQLLATPLWPHNLHSMAPVSGSDSGSASSAGFFNSSFWTSNLQCGDPGPKPGCNSYTQMPRKNHLWISIFENDTSVLSLPSYSMLHFFPRRNQFQPIFIKPDRHELFLHATDSTVAVAGCTSMGQPIKFLVLLEPTFMDPSETVLHFRSTVM